MLVKEVNTYLCKATLTDQSRKAVVADNIADACDIYYAFEKVYPVEVALVGVTLVKSS